MGRHSPDADTSRADISPWADTTAADGTHPTGMHSCSFKFRNLKKKVRLMVNDKVSCTYFSGSGTWYVTRVYSVNDQIKFF